MTHALIVTFALAGVAAQAIIAVLIVAAAVEALHVARPLSAASRLVRGYELWLVFLVAAVGTGASLFFSEVAGFVPCELCWYQRICLYPLSIVTLLAALREDDRTAFNLLPLPIVGCFLAVYQLLIENGVVKQSQACFISAPGGCATKWIDEFGYVTIPTLALTTFVLLGILLFLASTGAGVRAVEAW